MHTSQLKPTAQLVVQVYNEILYLAQIQQALDCTWQKKQVTREHWVKMTEYSMFFVLQVPFTLY